eukprot:2111863-Alexandrium_andersonii.AAC.1
MAVVRRADLARRHNRIGAPECPNGAARFGFPYRGGCASGFEAACSIALQPGALPTIGERSCGTDRQRSEHSELDVGSPHRTYSVTSIYRQPQLYDPCCTLPQRVGTPTSLPACVPLHCSDLPGFSHRVLPPRVTVADESMPGRRHAGSSCRSAPVLRRSGPLGSGGATEGSPFANMTMLPAAQLIGNGLAALSAIDHGR